VSKSRFDARAMGLRLGLGACLITTGITYAAPAPAAGDAAVTMASGPQRVAYNERVSLAGETSPGAVVKLEHAPQGASWRAVTQTTAGTDGAYRFTVRARRSGQWRAVTDAGVASAPRRVIVVAQLRGRARRHMLGVRSIGVRGRLVPGLAGRSVRLEVRSRGSWRLVDRTRTRAGGAYSAAFRPSATGVYRLRVRFAGDRSYAGDISPLPRVYVYLPGGASWYGPGFYGGRTACGQTLTSSIKGVAHRSLPCGTRVRLFYRGRSTTARVIDRGPFHGSRSWDLTPATKAALRFGSTGTVWAAY
jgi:peptidoglycan lytic transglycosylase